ERLDLSSIEEPGGIAPRLQLPRPRRQIFCARRGHRPAQFAAPNDVDGAIQAPYEAAPHVHRAAIEVVVMKGALAVGIEPGKGDAGRALTGFASVYNRHFRPAQGEMEGDRSP